ncbi:mitochondrial ribosomal small subunit component [Exophiala xenobiotica]|uniref:Small ribosomal subunit protein mS23 n=1 Tax=Lithohypha guttulata TaxID=1690604 RepID=A0ABR0JZ83_9EURO|nr:mitochondrial ribosomal small subunit component [Lithohypha guttulata]KAK5311187.1 mitochondrial ribosomal small subunit component [Exophiala xenobiotica]
MGRINLTPLRVRKRALADLQANRIPTPPVWLEVLADVPPAQILTRQQPQQHPLVQVRTKSLPDGKTEQVAIAAPTRKPKSSKRSRMFAPVEITYEEDQLRKQFFQDHPWELARPRTVLETTGDQHKNSDYSKGLQQPTVPLSGESVVQRQLHLLQTVPDITTDQAYDIARREFYTLRRQEATRRRIAKEEALHMGAQPERSILHWSMQIENKHYNDWEQWSKSQVMEQIQRSAAFSGAVAPEAEQKMLGGDGQDPRGARRADPFVAEAASRAGIMTGTL